MNQIQNEKKKKFIFDIIKMSGIVHVGVLYTTFLVLGSVFIDNLFSKFGTSVDKLEETPLWKIILEVFLEMAVIILWNALTRKIIKRVPFILENVGGFHIRKLKEINGTVLGAATLLLLLNDYKTKILFIINAFKQKLNI